MSWKTSILSPAILILLIHSLIWHEHGQHGLVLPSFHESEHSDISLLESLLSSDTGEEHLEVYHASKVLDGSGQWNSTQHTDDFFVPRSTIIFNPIIEFREKTAVPPPDISPQESIAHPYYRRGPPVRV